MKKQFLKTKPVCKVTFSIPSDVATEAKKVVVLGDFNDWNPEEGVEMKKLKDGSFKKVVNLDKGKEYQFRYLIDDRKWENDTDADKYVTNEYGGQNSVVIA